MARGANPKHAWLYVSGRDSNDVQILDLEEPGTPAVGLITDGIDVPFGVTVDGSGTAYVANGSGSVTIYPAGSTTPSLTLTQDLLLPMSVAVDAAGNVYVCNQISASGQHASIVVFPPGKSSPSQVITNNLIEDPTQIAFDGAGDMYYGDAFTGVSEVIAGSSGTFQPLNLQGIVDLNGLALDPLNGNLFVSTDGSKVAKGVQVYAPGGVLPLFSIKGAKDAQLLAIGSVRHEEFVFAPDFLMSEVFAFDHDDQGRKEIIKGTAIRTPFGVAIKPAGVP